MADSLTKEHRSWNMSRIRSTNSKPEIVVRSLLHRMGYRFRLHRKDLPGKPDIVLPKYRTVIFVHGCFWHRHERCRKAYQPKSRRNFWEKKFRQNKARDKKNLNFLEEKDWNVLVVWECEIDDISRLSERLEKEIKCASFKT
jgi:DNA mismatch endonuclease, patch repair protein